MESRRMTSRLSIWCLVGFIAVLAFVPQVEGRGVQSSWELRTFIFFTDGSRNPLSADSTGNPMDRRCLWEYYADQDRKSTRLNSSHSQISYAVFCLKKKK